MGWLEIPKLILEMIRVIREALSLWSKAKREGWIQDGKELTKAIQEAKSDEERRALLRRLVDHNHSMP